MITLFQSKCTVRGNGMPINGDNKRYDIIVKSSLFGKLNVLSRNTSWNEAMDILKNIDIKSFVYEDVICDNYVRQKCKVY